MKVQASADLIRRARHLDGALVEISAVAAGRGTAREVITPAGL